MYPSDALTAFFTIFYAVCESAVTILVPLFVVTWALRLTAELLRGGR